MQSFGVRRILAPLALVFAAHAVEQPALAEVELVQLTPTDARTLAARAPGFDIGTGDVLLFNDHLAVVIAASAGQAMGGGDRNRAGSCIIVGNNADRDIPFVQFFPGPVERWDKPEGGRNDSAGVVRFQQEGEDWNAELVYQLAADRTWLEVRTTLRNRHSFRTLEIPLVDLIASPDSAVGTSEQNQCRITHRPTGRTLEIVPTEPNFRVGPVSESAWWIYWRSGDPRPNILSKTRQRLARLGRSTTFSPIEADRLWDRNARDEEDWFRIAAGSERVIRRRISLASPMPQGTIEFHPSASPRGVVESQSAKPTIQGTLRDMNGSTAPRTLPELPNDPIAPLPPRIQATPVSRPKAPPAELEVKKPVPTPKPAAPPGQLPSAVLEIGDLPPPIE